MKSMRDRYQSDPHFHQLVDLMTGMIVQHKFTPSEMREAAVMASIRYEMMQPQRTIYLDPETEEAFAILRGKSCRVPEYYDPASGD